MGLSASTDGCCGGRVMTISEFCEKLKFVGTNWHVSGGANGPIRGEIMDGVRCCPITAVAETNHLGEAVTYGECLGLSTEDASEIVKAADGYEEYSMSLRRQLLDAVGLGG